MPEDRNGKEDLSEGMPEIEAVTAADAATMQALTEAIPVASPPEAIVEAAARTGSEQAAEPEESTTAEPPTLEPATVEPTIGEPRAVEAQTLETKPDAEPVEKVDDEVVLERKHPLAIRWMHWINFPVLFTMIWSGLLIYWNDSAPPGRYAHEVYRLGFGHWTLFRFFPDWFYTNRFWDMRYKVTDALGYHFLFMWIFAVNGIAYVLYLLISKEWKFMVPQRRSFVDAIQVTLVDLHLRKELPFQTKYNGGQRIAYSAVILMGLGALATGLSIYKPTQVHWLTSLLGGYEMARWLHFWLTMGFCGFFLVHVGQVVLAGWNNFRSMVSGYEIRRIDEPSLEAERRQF